MAAQTSAPLTDFDLSTVVTIVTGLPRSGTSLMMQMLEAGGLDVLDDGIRTADEDNPKGYLECERVKDLRNDASWVAGAKGKAAKVVAPLLQYLPLEQYRVVFMDRELNEVLRSQATMLDRAGKAGARLTDDKLKAVYQKQLAQAMRWLQARNLPVITIRYRDCIDSPRQTADEVNQFLGGKLDAAAMADVVDPQLYRQRS